MDGAAEPLMHRAELLASRCLADLVVESRAARSSTSQMEKRRRKRTRREISEEVRVKAENSPIVRELRELYARGSAELGERRRQDAPR